MSEGTLNRIGLEGPKLTLNLSNIFWRLGVNCLDETTCDVILNLVTQVWGKYMAVL